MLKEIAMIRLSYRVPNWSVLDSIWSICMLSCNLTTFRSFRRIDWFRRIRLLNPKGLLYEVSVRWNTTLFFGWKGQNTWVVCSGGFCIFCIFLQMYLEWRVGWLFGRRNIAYIFFFQHLGVEKNRTNTYLLQCTRSRDLVDLLKWESLEQNIKTSYW